MKLPLMLYHARHVGGDEKRFRGLEFEIEDYACVVT
jgi:hypothetical protein